MADDPSDPQTAQRALTAAHLYYVQERTMEAIARELRTSRSTVSRLLAHARATGIVDIRVRSPFDAPRRLEDDIAERFGVTAHVVPVTDDATEVESLDRVAAAAAHLLHDLVQTDMTVGVAWGSTTAAVSRRLVPKPVRGTAFVQLNGSGNTHTTGLLYASEILRRFAAAFGGSAQQFPVPAFFDDPRTRSAMWRERSTRRILALQETMDIVVFSTGAAASTVPSHVYTGGYLEARDLEALARERVVGDVATVFYRADGSSTGIALNDRATGPAFEVLRRVPRRVCIVSGVSKLASLRGALAAGLVTDLVVDDATARALQSSGDAE
ncbi:DNA-binding transcriptional regulator LsrR (DeoR family) [Microbacterium terrae]|uniref:Deoxyribonucleoside regulator n=1 Tax=Microbacterium terrae TaxID=69369 RepID=A0A0M2H6B1_9MICO|nr:sugar-binding domain-containing protein [Microbacterium terrae]KJL39447.1 Deoxyribonucleoside regulator [Microbacterium terrae]MBP1078039.1 DNA-binding transcriptional regulator LsrR (DeoR family) [Microbacterium terrae]GLK00208.1 transcriptional regulator [Microbacterium terrae]